MRSRGRLTPEGETDLDERVAALHDRHAAFGAYLEAFFDDAAQANGWSGGDVTFNVVSGDLLLTAYLRRAAPREPMAFDRRMTRDDWREWVDRTEERLYPGTGSGRDIVVERAYLFRPQWHIEKTAARELVKRMAPPPPAAI
jgi:hypothetical protein